MIDRIRATFDRLSRQRRKALIPFIMAGDPSLEATEQLAVALSRSGADLVEIGIPFSDPLADGPVIQRVSHRALEHGTTPQEALRCVSRAAAKAEVPLVLLTYWNPILQYGRSVAGAGGPRPDLNGMDAATAFASAASRAGASGVIIPDLPLEEAGPFRQSARRWGLATIFLAAPTSPAERLRRIAQASQGFIYYVSLTGTTGTRERLPAEWLHGVRQLKLITTTPVCVGFGISTPEQAAAVGRVADGVIIGSALLKAIEPYRSSGPTMIREACVFVQRFRKVV